MHTFAVDVVCSIEGAGCNEIYDQVDSAAYLIHPWMKYPKFG